MELKAGDRVRVVGQEKKTATNADGSTRSLTNHEGQTGEVWKAPIGIQKYKSSRTDKERDLAVITVKLDGEEKLRGFPVDQLEKV